MQIKQYHKKQPRPNLDRHMCPDLLFYLDSGSSSILTCT